MTAWGTIRSSTFVDGFDDSRLRRQLYGNGQGFTISLLFHSHTTPAELIAHPPRLMREVFLVHSSIGWINASRQYDDVSYGSRVWAVCNSIRRRHV